MKNENYKIPLVIGVTGHRDIHKSCIKSLQKNIRNIFDQLIEKYPHTPIIFLSPLADGADRIVAEVAFEFKENITVSAPLPMDIESYIKTFAKGITIHKESTDEKKLILEKESCEEFDKLLNQVKSQTNDYVPKIIPMLFDEESYENSSEDEQRNIRRQQYSIVGEYIAIHSNILIALYDDNEKENPGGTKEIVRKKLEGSYEYFKVKDFDVNYPEDGIVYKINTIKGKNQNKLDSDFVKLFPKNKEENVTTNKINSSILNFLSIKDYISKSCYSIKEESTLNFYSKQHKKIDCFNREVENEFDAISKVANNDIEKLNVTDKLIHKNIMIRRSAAFLSEKFDSKMKELQKLILFLSMVTIFSLMIKSSYSNFEFNKYIDIFYLFAIGIFYILHIKFKNYKENKEDFRGLSEVLRIQTAWNLANINESTSLYYLAHQKDGIGWLRTTMRGINIFYIPKKTHEKFDRNIVDKYWIDNQIGYFDKNLKKHKNAEKKLNFKLKTWFILFVLLNIGYVIEGFTSDISSSFEVIFLGLTSFELLKIVLLGTPLIVSAYFKAIQLFEGNDEIIKEYTISFYSFNRAKKLLDLEDEINYANKKEIYRNLGIEALRENSTWLINRRKKDHSLT